MKFNIRKAQIKDIESIAVLLKPYSKDGVILERTKEDLEHNVERFFVAEIKNTIAGAISYYIYSDTLIEIRSLAVKKKYYKLGIGSALIRSLLESVLRDFSGVKLFALTYHPLFFNKLNFKVVPKDSLPEKIWKDCKYCLNQNNCNETALVYEK